MALLVDGGIAARGVGLVAARQQHRRAQVHGATPPRGKDRALDLDVLHPARVGRQLDRRQGSRELQADRIGPSGIEVQPANLAHQIAGRLGELLALPLIVVQPQQVPIDPAELGVDVGERLDVVVAGGDLFQARHRITERAGVDDGRGAGRQGGDVDAEERRAVALVTHLEPWLGVGVARNEDVDAAG